MKRFDVICIGFICQDIVMTDIPLDALTRDSAIASQVIHTSGGDANNQAVTLSRLGDHTGLLVKIGMDPVGNSIYHDLEAEPLDLSLVIRDPKAKMNLAICCIQKNGERSFLCGKGNDSFYLTEEDIDPALLSQTRAITIGSLFALRTLDTGGIARLFQKANQVGTLTFCDMTVDMMGIGPDAIEEVYPNTDYMMPSLEEATYVTGKTDPDEIADFFLRRGVKTVVLKLGAEGCFVKNADTRFFQDPYDIVPVDTTGCGDNFLAGFVHSILKGSSLQEAALFATGTGALNACGYGAHLTVQSEAQVKEFMATHVLRPITGR